MWGIRHLSKNLIHYTTANNNNNKNNNNNNKKNMHREIRAFLQHLYGITATIGHSCNVLGHFRNI